MTSIDVVFEEIFGNSMYVCVSKNMCVLSEILRYASKLNINFKYVNSYDEEHVLSWDMH